MRMGSGTGGVCACLDDLAKALSGVTGAAGEFGLGAARASGDLVPDEVVEFLAGPALGLPGFGYTRKCAAEVVHDR